ncbi:MAG: BMP family ABC transporter substrate-binding protein [Actinobacteria bacterium]|nr:BMP family ABC transporter substrate-binding protein [Actinomycetota bacterium]
MSKHRLVPFGLAALVAMVLMAVGFAASGTAAPQATFKAGLVSDVGRFNDKGFNQNQLTGMKRAAKTLKIQYRAVESRSAGDYLPNMASLARSGYNIVISAGYLMSDTTEDVADQFPNTKFAITDQGVAAFKRKHSNIEGLTYDTQENSYLVGCLAAKVAARSGKKNISVVGGVKIPPVDTFLAGYKAGAQKCAPGTTVQTGYSGTFIDQTACKTIASNQIDAGSQVVFSVAGPCGLGALDAAKERGRWGVGVDVDQSFLGNYILTSAVKRVDVGIFLAVKGAKSGKGYKRGGDLVFNLKNQGVALGKISAKAKIPKAWLTQINKLKAQIIAGKIKPPKTVG